MVLNKSTINYITNKIRDSVEKYEKTFSGEALIYRCSLDGNVFEIKNDELTYAINFTPLGCFEANSPELFSYIDDCLELLVRSFGDGIKEKRIEASKLGRQPGFYWVKLGREYVTKIWTIARYSGEVYEDGSPNRHPWNTVGEDRSLKDSDFAEIGKQRLVRPE